jgi:hypothetical protein
VSDVRIETGGRLSSMVLITPVSYVGRQWIDENLQVEGWQWLGRSLAVDKRYAAPIVDGMIGDGLDVEAS